MCPAGEASLGKGCPGEKWMSGHDSTVAEVQSYTDSPPSGRSWRLPRSVIWAEQQRAVTQGHAWPDADRARKTRRYASQPAASSPLSRRKSRLCRFPVPTGRGPARPHVPRLRSPCKACRRAAVWLRRGYDAGSLSYDRSQTGDAVPFHSRVEQALLAFYVFGSVVVALALVLGHAGDLAATTSGKVLAAAILAIGFGALSAARDPWHGRVAIQVVIVFNLLATLAIVYRLAAESAQHPHDKAWFLLPFALGMPLLLALFYPRRQSR